MVLVAFPQSSPASTLAGYLRSQNIPCDYRFVDDKHLVILQREDDFAAAQQILQQFLENPNDKIFQQIAWQSSAPVSLVSGSNILSLSSIVGAFRSAPFSALILVLALFIHLVVFVFGQYALFDQLYFQGVNEISQNGQFWRIITPTLMHFSAMHLIFNLAWWWILGRDIEVKFGVSALLALYLLTGVLSNYAQFLMAGPNFGGLSGVVYGLFGFVWWCGWLRPEWQLNLSKPLIGFMLLWLVFGFTDVLWINMANTAHLTGLVCGCLMAWLASQVFRRS